MAARHCDAGWLSAVDPPTRSTGMAWTSRPSAGGRRATSTGVTSDSAIVTIGPSDSMFTLP